MIISDWVVKQAEATKEVALPTSEVPGGRGIVVHHGIRQDISACVY